MKMQYTSLLAGALALSLPVASVGAQDGITLWAGMGGASQDGSMVIGRDAKQLGIQLSLPIVPIALRADALLFGSRFDADALSYTGALVLQMKLPVLQPYGLLGRGRYATGSGTAVRGNHYGAGGRVGVGRFGVFAEVRRHDPIGRTVTVVGVTF
jgi:hypothetical protein